MARENSNSTATFWETAGSHKVLLQDVLVIWFAIGTLLGLISSVMVFAAIGDSMLALAVGFAVLVPWVFKQLDFDPALGSGPICTIIQDVSS